MLTEIKIPTIGKVSIDKATNTIHKAYTQSSPGSAYKKIPADIIAIELAGYNKIKLSVNPGYPEKKKIQVYVDYFNRLRLGLPPIEVIYL